MLTKNPYFTLRVESTGARFEAKLNGLILEDNSSGTNISYEMPVNEYMFTGTNRVGLNIYAFAPDNYGNAKVILSLYVNRNEAPESEKKMLSRVVFDSAKFAAGNGVEGSVVANTLDSKNKFSEDEQGDVIIHSVNIKPSMVRPYALEVYQDVELETPFPRWGFLDAEPYDFPVEWKEFQDNYDQYLGSLIKPVYDAHLEIYKTLESGDIDKFLDFFDERNNEYDIAMYQPVGTTRAGFKKKIEEELASTTHDLKIEVIEYAPPIVSDNRNLVKLTDSGIIYFEAKDESSYHNYEIQMYKKNGKWVVGR